MTNYLGKKNNVMAKNIKYFSALEEIIYFLDAQKDQFGNYVYHINEPGANKILNIINEVLDERKEYWIR